MKMRKPEKKILALALAVIMTLGCGMSALAEENLETLYVDGYGDVVNYKENIAINQQPAVVSTSGTIISVGNIDNDTSTAFNALNISMQSGAAATVNTGDINQKNDENPVLPAVKIFTNGAGSNLELSTGKINSDDVGLYVGKDEGHQGIPPSPNDGVIKAKTGEIISKKESVVIYNKGDATITTLAINSGDDGLDINNEGGTVDAKTGAITSGDVGVDIKNYYDGTVTVGTGAITSESDGLDIFNQKGTVTATTGAIDAKNAGVQITSSQAGDETTGTNNVTIKGPMTVEATEENHNTIGINVSDPNGFTNTVTANGNITVTGNEASDETTNFATGIIVNTKGTSTITTNDSNIKVSGQKAYGTQLIAIGNNNTDTVDAKLTTLTVNLDGDMKVIGDNRSIGIRTIVDNNTKTTLNMEGNLDVSTTGENGNATAFTGTNHGGTIDATITGNMTSTGIGIEMVGDYANQGKSDETKNTTSVEVVGNVTADETGASITLENKKDEMDLIVDGTLSGEKQSVLLSADTITDNLTLTVWEIKGNDAGNLVERVEKNDRNEKIGTVADTEAEKKIQYIIRIDPDYSDVISTDAREYEGYHVANEDEIVTLKLNVPEGYKVTNAFNGTDVKVALKIDADGNYYLEVPRGGAVMLSVELEEIPKPESEQESNSKLNPKAHSGIGGFEAETPVRATGGFEAETPAQATGGSEKNYAKMTVPTLLTLTDTTGAMKIILYSNGNYKAVLSHKQVDYGTFAAKDDHIVLTSKTGKTIEVAKDGSNWKLTFSGEGDKTYEFAISAEDMQKLIDAAVLTHKKADNGNVKEDDNIVLTSETGETIEVAKDGDNWKLTFSGEGDTTYELSISAEEMQGLIGALNK